MAAEQFLPGLRPRGSILRKVLHHTVHLPASRKAPALLAGVLLLSCAAWLELSPRSGWLADKNNAVNSLLVKWSWGWTLLCLCPSVMLTAFLYTGLRWWAALRHFSRLLVAHCMWFSVTHAFVLLDSAVGACGDGSGSSRRECLRGGGSWAGFDISGHVFLLSYCVYVLTEEVAGLRWEVWGEFDGCLQMETRALSKQAWVKEVLPSMHRLSSPLAVVLELLAAALMAVWVAMMVSTSLFFHSLAEKLVGGVCGWLAWQLTYGWLYGRGYMPSRPDQGLLHPLGHVPCRTQGQQTHT